MPAQADGLLEQPSTRTPLRARVARGGKAAKRVPSSDSSSWQQRGRAVRRDSLRQRQEAQDATSSPAMLAHEVKRRVSALRVAAEAAGVLQQRGRDPQPMMDRLLGEIRELEQLTRTLLDRDRAGSCEVTDLVGAAQAAADTVRAARGASVVLAHPSEPVGAVAQPGMARQALENLIENAARYGEEPVEVTVRQVGDWAEVVVADHGLGWGGAPKRAQDGNGLGLVLVRQVTEAAGGHLWSRCRPGGGTVFGLRLPAAGMGG
jgi:two-component system sensor histidine kinase MprB